MNRVLLLALLGQTYLEPFAFDDDEDDTPDGDEDEPDDEPDDDDKDAGKNAKDEKKSDKRSNRDSPESLKKQVSDLQKKLAGKNKRITDLARERANLNRQLKGGGKSQQKQGDDGDDGDGDDSEVVKLQRTVTELTDRLDNLSSENFIEKNVIRKLQPLVAAGLEEDEANRKLNAAMKLVDSDEDFDDDGNFDATGFMERHPYLAVEAKEDTSRDRLIGGSGKKGKSKKDYVGDALKRFNEARTGVKK